MSDLLRGVLEITVALPEGATLGPKTARGHCLLFLGHGLTVSLATSSASGPTGRRRRRWSSRGLSPRPASARLTTRFRHAGSVIRNCLTMMLLTVVSVAAQGAYTASTLMVSQTLCTLTAAIGRSLRTVLCEMVMALAVAASDTRRPHRGTEGMDMVRRGSSVRSGLKLQLYALGNLLPGLGLTRRLLLTIEGEGAPQG